jgi:hypothetical protein
MPSLTSPPSRRAVLGGALAGLAAPVLAACTPSNPFVPAPPAPVPPDVVAADRAAERERELLAAYDAAMLLAPQLADRLLPVRGEHAAHLAALGRPEVPAVPAVPASPAGDPTAAATPTASPSPAPPAVPAPPLPADPAALLVALAELERRAATAHGAAAVRAGLGVGAVLASVAASEASHVVALS